MLKMLSQLRLLALVLLVSAVSYGCQASDTGNCEGFFWLPDSQQIVFATFENTYVMESDGSQIRQLKLNFSNIAKGYDVSISDWSPDGKHLLLVTHLKNSDPRERFNYDQIYIMSTDGSQSSKTLVDNGFSPQWSPDGKRISFSSYKAFLDSYWELYSINADGSKQIKLTNDSDVAGQITWSPDSKQILFIHSPSVEQSEIYTVDAEGLEKPKKLADGSDPEWSPDGKRIAFFESSEIHIMNRDGSGAFRLYHFSIKRAYKHGLKWTSDKKLFSWFITCKDGKKFSSDICELKIQAMDVDDSKEIQQILSFSAVGDAPSWSPDGKKIGFISRGFLYTANADGSNLKRVR